jgi:hypothetical protein
VLAPTSTCSPSKSSAEANEPIIPKDLVRRITNFGNSARNVRASRARAAIGDPAAP